MGGYFGGKVLRRIPGYHYFAEDPAQVRASIRRLLACKPSRIFTGHGGPLSPEAVAQRFAVDPYPPPS
jgi:hypothetical protein